MKKIILLFLVLIPLILIGQETVSIDLKSNSTIDCPINKFYESFTDGEDVIVLSDTREAGDLNILISIFDKTGNKVSDVLIGKDNAYERPIGLSKIKNGTRHLLSNIYENGKTELVLFTLDQSYSVLSQKEIATSGISEGNAMIINGDILIIAASNMGEDGGTYLKIIEYNLTTENVVKEYSLDQQNSNIKEKPETRTKFNENNEKVGEITVMSQNKLYKMCNSLQFTNNEKNEILLTGYENSELITDFWACLIKDGQIQWERIYDSQIGGDECQSLFALDNGTFLLSGVGYTKRKEENYTIRNLIINKSGDLLKEERLKEKTRTFHKGAIRLSDNRYAFLGQAETVEYSNFLFNNTIKSTGILVAIKDENLNLLGRKNIDINTEQEVLGFVKFSDNLLGVFHKEETTIGIMKLKLK